MSILPCRESLNALYPSGFPAVRRVLGSGRVSLTGTTKRASCEVVSTPSSDSSRVQRRCSSTHLCARRSARSMCTAGLIERPEQVVAPVALHASVPASAERDHHDLLRPDHTGTGSPAVSARGLGSAGLTMGSSRRGRRRPSFCKHRACVKSREVGDPRFELGLTEPESAVLPLHQSPVTAAMPARHRSVGAGIGKFLGRRQRSRSCGSIQPSWPGRRMGLARP